MSTLTHEAGKIGLTVRASNPAVEIFIIDGHFRQVAKGLGELTTNLAPGLYKIKYRAGSLIEERHLLVEPGQTPLAVFGPEMPFSTSAPLNQTRTSREYHQGNAVPHSRQVHETLGQGSQLFFFSRDLDPSRPDNVAEGLSLHSLDGALLLDLAQAGVHHLQEQWAACTVALEPGLYRLRLDLAGERRLEQTIVASSGWQTQVFLLRRDFGPNLRRADLFNAAILLAGLHEGFEPGRPDWRLTELARLGLVNGRAVISTQELNQILYSKFENPMLALYGGHLLLLAERPNWDLLETVVHNAYRLLGQAHPDVQALALALTTTGKDVPIPTRCETPPMLRRSWRLLIEASVTRPGLIPPGALTARMADRVWGDGAWLVWQLPEEGATRAPGLAPPPLQESVSQMAQLLAEPQRFKAVLDQADLTDVEESVLRYAFHAAQQPGRSLVVDFTIPDQGPPVPSPEASLSQATGLPPAALQQTLAGLVNKLAGSGAITISGAENQVIGGDVQGDVVKGDQSSVSIGQVGSITGSTIAGGDVHVTGPQQQTIFDQREQQVGTQYNVAGDLSQTGADPARPSAEAAPPGPNRQANLPDLSRQIRALPQAGPADQAELVRLLALLETALANLPPERQDEVEVIVEQTQALIAAAGRERANRVQLRTAGQSLQQVAAGLADVSPLSGDIVGRLVAKILALAG